MGIEEGEEEEAGGGEASKTFSCAWFKLERIRPAVGSTVEVTVLAGGGTEAAAGCRRGWLEWIDAGAVLGPTSN